MSENTAVKDLYDNYFDRLLKIKDVFVDYYGEDRVDLQIPSFEQFCNSTCSTYFSSPYAGPISEQNDDTITRLYSHKKNLNFHLLVYFPDVTVTNENEDSINIKDLYVKFSISREGSLAGSFYMTRTSYTKAQWSYRYIHSHAQSLNSNWWSGCCLGSGPISRTISMLCRNFDLDLYLLLCGELDIYTRTESLSGGPYIRMYNITNANVDSASNYMEMYYSFSGINHNDKMEFFYKLLSEYKGKFNYNDKYVDLDISTEKKIWLFTEICRSINNPNFIYTDCFIHRGIIKRKTSSSNNLTVPTTPIFKFKNDPKYIRIQDVNTDPDNGIVLLSWNIFKTLEVFTCNMLTLMVKCKLYDTTNKEIRFIL
jgi:hypothetical protein